MNGVHDLGGRHGFGKVNQGQTRHFPNAWERKVFGLTLACGFLGRWNLDEARYARETMAPEAYLNSSYYAHWLHGLECLLVEKGLVSEQELSTGESIGPCSLNTVSATQVRDIVQSGSPTQLHSDNAPRFGVGDTVSVIRATPRFHTRVPGYCRGALGVVRAYYGAHVFPDHHAKTGEKQPAHLYSVQFDENELWGREHGEANTKVRVDMFEPYLQKAAQP